MLCYRLKPKKMDDFVCTGGMAREVLTAIFVLFYFWQKFRRLNIFQGMAIP
ncbi:hypothetical protein SAMN05444406_1269 [Caldicoprobacter faecalis]|uniref:Uncharacterized protein n=1 Tax=Caldicoprobacter faecalis TaxID=937334 RepID=A0A1I5XGZ8_9FIRM|nr:hypothetical protein SAMN05444406_1269 [Caldicoprobacter faecalis]